MKQEFHLLKQRVAMLMLLLVCSVATLMAQVAVKGVVVDANGEPILGANVLEVGTTNGTVTDFDGNFALSVKKVGAELNVTYIGYVPQTVPAAKDMKITLAEDSEALEEVVVVGYGVTKRKNFTGSVATMNVSDSPVANLAPTSPTDMLRGMIPGLNMSQSGVAGSAANITIRGAKSVDAAKDASLSMPLIVVNGVIFKGTMNDIDPNIVESMSVLKDATSLAAYGSQAANGVIMITTKKGAMGKPMINFRSSVALSEAAYKTPLRDGKGYIELINARQGLPEGSTNWMTYLEKANYEKGEETDWIDYYSQTGVRQNYSLNISGATENMDYSFGGSISDNDNFIKGNKFIRNTVNGRFNTKVNKYIKLGMNFNYATMKMDGVRPYTSRYFSPWGEPYLEDGVTLRRFITEHTADDVNPMWQVNGGVDAQSRSNNIDLGGEVEIRIPGIEGLSYKMTGSYNVRQNLTRRFYHEQYYIGMGEEYTAENFDKHLSQANGYINNTKNTSFVMDHILTYTKDFGQHFLSVTAVYTRDSNKVDGSQESGLDFAGLGNTTLGFYGLNNAKTQKVDDITYTLHNNVGYLGRVNYSYKDTYHFNASIRRDGSSVFGRDKKWGTFPAVGVAWSISNESFFQKALPWATNTKIKASWGKNGNQSLQPYQTLSQMNVGMAGGYTAYFGNEVIFGQSMRILGNPMLGWETTTSWNFGLETDLLKDGRIHFELDAYTANTTDQIFNRTIPVMGSGMSTQQSTMGKINNWGIEATLRTMNIRKKDFSWSTNFQFTLSRSILKELYGDGNDDITNELFLNRSLGAIYGYEYDRVAQVEDTQYLQANGGNPGDPMYVDHDGDGVITPNDRVILGFNTPSFLLNMGNTITWKNFSLYFLFSGTFSGGKYGVDRNNNAFVSYENMAYLNAENHPFWTEANRDMKHVGATADLSKFTGIQKYGFVRLQDVNLSYNFKGNWMKKVGINSLQAYVSGSNLFFIAPDWEFSDPEVRSSRASQLARTYTLGLNVRF
ncbi:MAG: SusC/RagA family TonB-linked outer membrane protein [Bacteroidaceae bacterium]|nr:SusC/RagA family TonB-linked outer membrane protein [Bacteroidaceae bacterium]